MQEKPGLGKSHPWQQRVDILGKNGKEDNQGKAQVKENFMVYPTLSFHFREAIWYFKFRLEIENANQKILLILLILSK